MSEVITTIGLTVHFQYRQFIHVGIAAIKELFHEPEDAFWTGRAMNLLFDGIEIDCSTTNPLAKLACAEISKNKSPTIQLITTKKMKFSLLGGVRCMFSSILHNIEVEYCIFSIITHRADTGK